MSSAIETCVSLCLCAKAVTSGPRMTEPLSFINSARTPTGGNDASLQRSTQASVCPDRISTPPSRATRGNTWPGRTKSAAPLLSLASARTVLQRSSAEMPVVKPCLTSTETARLISAKRGADDPGRIADDERHLFRRAMRCRDEKIAFVFAVIVISNDNNLAIGEGLDRGFDATVAVGHGSTSKAGLCAWFERPRSPLAHLAAMHQIVV